MKAQIGPLLWVFAGLAALLSVASMTGWLLRRRAAGEASRATLDNLVDRVNAWWVMIGLCALAFAAGPRATLVLFALMSFYTLREFVSLTPTRAADVWPVAAAFYLFLPLQYVLVAIEWYALFAIAIPVYAFLLLPSLAALAGDVDSFLLRVARLQWGLMLTVYCLSHAPALLTLDVAGEAGGYGLLLFLLIVVQFSDVAQYVFGKLFGKTKVAPVVSPSKTWEGLIGGGASATLVGAALSSITPFTPLQAGAMAFAVVVSGFLGGLSLSAVKRSMGAKDWGTMVKGHGGALDRLDSVTFSAPLFFHLTRYFFTP
jgi:phosphatidate cytidylyltransferase